MNETESKIRVTLPEYIYNFIINDEKDFEINKKRLCNMIFEMYGEDVNIEEHMPKTKYNKILQFNLSNNNLDMFVDISTRKEIANKADYFRKLFFMYCDQPKYKREQQICSSTVIMAEGAIKSGKKLKIKYKDSYRVVEPYFIACENGETRNYLFCYCYNNQEYRNYRLINIKGVSILREDFEHYNEEYIKNIRDNFDPYLSYGSIVKVKISRHGQELMEKVVINRPKLMEQEGDIFTFQCSDLKAKLYFPQFLGSAEIIEPQELREWFKQEFEKAAEKYRGK